LLAEFALTPVIYGLTEGRVCIAETKLNLSGKSTLITMRIYLLMCVAVGIAAGMTENLSLSFLGNRRSVHYFFTFSVASVLCYFCASVAAAKFNVSMLMVLPQSRRLLTLARKLKLPLALSYLFFGKALGEVATMWAYWPDSTFQAFVDLETAALFYCFYLQVSAKEISSQYNVR
jgi:hypothetical protein